jgi:predicted alpha/beta-fold hydrolase
LAVLALGYFGTGLFVATRLTTPVRQPTEQTPADEGLDFREVGFESTDGLRLEGWWVPGNDSSRAVVLIHGLEGSKAGEQVLRTASVYSGTGYGVLMFDLRGHGEFEGKRTTVGHQEVRDVRGALSWLEERGFEPGEVVLHGWSMGGATVLRSASRTRAAAHPPDEASSHAAVLVHGWEGDKSNAQVVETALIYVHAGYGLLLLNLRGSGSSGNERRTLGYRKTRDVRGALS